MTASKNLWVIPTDKPSRLCLDSKDKLWFAPNSGYTIADGKQNIYITSDEEIKMGEEVWYLWQDKIYKNKKGETPKNFCKKIILTTDQDLIKNGVQAIDDEFLETWFVKNPSCEYVDIFETYNQEKNACSNKCKWGCHSFFECKNVDDTDSSKTYKIIIPKEETNIIDQWLEKNGNPEISKQVEEEAKELCKQETLEESKKILGVDFEYSIDDDGMSIEIPIHKQETLEEDSKSHAIYELENNYKPTKETFKLACKRSFIKGFKLGQERSYSEEEAGELVYNIIGEYGKHYGIMIDGAKLNELFEQFKKK